MDDGIIAATMYKTLGANGLRLVHHKN